MAVGDNDCWCAGCGKYYKYCSCKEDAEDKEIRKEGKALVKKIMELEQG